MSEFLLSRRVLLLGALPAACGLAPGIGEAAVGPTIDARAFGASPTASALVNSRAFAEASAAINRAGGGTLFVPPGEYRVGHQSARQSFADIIRIEGCRQPVVVSGKGVKLKAADRLRFGSFHPRTGDRFDPTKLPFLDPAYAAGAYEMILIRNCSGPIRIEGFELAGNLDRYELGGQWNDQGRQLPADGIFLESNTGGVTISSVNSHHHGRDGIIVMHPGLTATSPRYPVTLTDVICDRNARQGLSWVGGTELTAIRCRFSRTGRAAFHSAPAAGVDVEAESSVCRNGRFIECEFVDNVGVGFVAEVGDAANIRLERCTFVGTTTWSAWPRKPGIVFQDCTFVGSVTNVFADQDAKRATQFLSCNFRGDRALSPTGKVYGEFLTNLGAGATNVLMSGCDFDAIDPEIALAWTPVEARFHNCRFRQRGSATSHPRGIYTGVSRIDSAGPVDLAGSRFIGQVFLNGKSVS